MIDAILFTLWFFLPAAIANVSPIILVKFKSLDFIKKPIDFGLKFRGNRVFGDHKTILGFVGGIVAATVTFTVQKQLFIDYDFIRDFCYIDYSEFNVFLYGFLFGFGALGGDAVKSFFKRQIGIEPGKAWPPFDQLDYIIGTILITYPFVQLATLEYVLMLVIWALIHVISTYVGFVIKLKSSPI